MRFAELIDRICWRTMVAQASACWVETRLDPLSARSRSVGTSAGGHRNMRDSLSSNAEIVGQPILAGAGFQPALAEQVGLRISPKGRLKGGCGQDCPPHDLLRLLKRKQSKRRWDTCPTRHPGAK